MILLLRSSGRTPGRPAESVPTERAGPDAAAARSPGGASADCHALGADRSESIDPQPGPGAAGEDPE